MYLKVIVATVLVTLLVVASLFTLAFVFMPQFAGPWQAYGMMRQGQGYPGMMGGGMMGGRTRGGMMGGMMQGGMMNGGMMGGTMRGGMMGGPGYWNTPVAPNSPSDSPAAPTAPAAPPSSSDVAPTRTPVPSNPPTTNRGRGAMMGGGQTPGGLVAVSPDGKALPIDSTSKLPDNAAAQKVGNLSVALALSPYPPSGFSKSDFDVTLTDDKGQAVTDAKITLNLTMPAMWMPTNTPTAQHVGEGRYHATGMFTMRGLWRMEVIIERGGARQSAYFDVWL